MGASVTQPPVDVELLDPWLIVGLVVGLVLAVILVVLAVGRRRARQEELHDRFGSEYVRAIETARSRRRAEEQLVRRLERRDGYELRALDPVERDAFRARWEDVQLGFVDGPTATVHAALGLIADVAVARGYPDDGVDRCLDDLSVDHPELVADLRQARSAGDATTEDHREAVVRARLLFERLVGSGTRTPPAQTDDPEVDDRAPLARMAGERPDGAPR